MAGINMETNKIGGRQEAGIRGESIAAGGTWLAAAPVGEDYLLGADGEVMIGADGNPVTVKVE